HHHDQGPEDQREEAEQVLEPNAVAVTGVVEAFLERGERARADVPEAPAQRAQAEEGKRRPMGRGVRGAVRGRGGRPSEHARHSTRSGGSNASGTCPRSSRWHVARTNDTSWRVP